MGDVVSDPGAADHTGLAHTRPWASESAVQSPPAYAAEIRPFERCPGLLNPERRLLRNVPPCYLVCAVGRPHLHYSGDVFLFLFALGFFVPLA